MPRARSAGTNGALAALNTMAASTLSLATRWATESPVWLSVSSVLRRAAGRCTSSIPRCVRWLGSSAVDHHLVPSGYQSLPDLLDRRLEAAVPSRHSPGTDHCHAHVCLPPQASITSVGQR